MKPVVLKPDHKEDLNHSAPKKVVEEDTFEQDWANGISGDEFLRRVHEHIRKLYATQPKK
ncbi:MAG: hypothetical protein LC107_04670 [Chitinophagales bacterium]|nr:hypothetical protein [Chitinophagales bacterium]